MDSAQLNKEVFELIDSNCMEISKQEYLDFLNELIGDLSVRADGIEEEIEQDEEE